MTMGEALDAPISFHGMYYRSDAWKARKQEYEMEEGYRRALFERMNNLIEVTARQR